MLHRLCRLLQCGVFASLSHGAEPVLRALQPAAVTAGGPAFTLVVNGQGFTATTRILLDGTAFPTQIQSDTRLEADIPATRIARAAPISIAVTRTDKKATEALTLAVNPPLAWIVEPNLPSAPHTQFYAQALAISGGTPPVRFALASGAAPPGLHLDGYNGTIVGYASVQGMYDFSVKAMDSAGATASLRLQLAVTGELRILTGPALPAAVAGQTYSAQAVAEGGTPPVAEWKIIAGALPRGLVLDEKTGRISGVANSAPGMAQLTLRARDSAGKTVARSMTLDVRVPLSVALPDSAGDLAEGDAVDIRLSATGGAGEYSWTLAAGDLPPGIEFDSVTGRLRGTLTQAGTYRLSLRVRDAGGAEAPATVALHVAARLRMTEVARTETVMGAALSLPLAATGGAPPYTFRLAEGALPEGVALTAGRIEGVPRREGESVFTIEVRDRAGHSTLAEARLLVLLPPLPALEMTPLSGLSPARQTKLEFLLDHSHPADLALIVQLGFDGPSDPAILFSTGGRLARVVIPAGQLAPAAPLSLQTGTTAGTIQIEASLVSAGRTAQSVLRQSAVVAPTPPQIRAIKLQKTGDGFEVLVSAYSPTREFETAKFVFDDSIQINLPIGELTGRWFADAQSTAFGTALTYRQTFTVRGDISRLRGVSVSLTNGVGASVPASAAF